MSLLVIQLPAHQRLASRAAAAGTEPRSLLPEQWAYVLSADGHHPSQVGQAAAAQLPKADQSVLVLAEADVSWHQIEVPRAPAARLRAALAGVMEEALLDEHADVHFALADGAAPGRKGWIAVTNGRRLSAALALLEDSGRSVERAVPGSWPGMGRGHFSGAGAVPGVTVGEDEAPWLTLAQDDGVRCLRLSGSLARALLPTADAEAPRWTSTPAAAQAAERLLGAPVALMSEAERVLESATSRVNLRQFDLAPRYRGTRALRDMARRLFTAEWRPVRYGLLALLLIEVVGLNAQAWQLGRSLDARRAAMAELLKTSHPGVRVVLDAPLQMQRESDVLRAQAGRAGAGDLEPLLAAAAAAWPDGAGPTSSLRFEPGSLTLSASGWAEPQAQQFRERMRGAGYAAEVAQGRVVVTRLSARGSL